jgi:lipopolysaccharide/colanic/teichoic acid biosynthesis glycosyltransferase
MGHKGKTFKIIKFQTMVEGAEKIGPQFTMENDPRVTPIGKMMRKFRIDEIPQFLNVIKGDLSLVGPRPERKYFVRKYEKIIPFYRLRLEVKPGITGWAQVNHKYAGEEVEDHKKKLEYDFYYIKNRNLLMDFVILLKTMKTVLNLRGR